MRAGELAQTLEAAALGPGASTRQHSGAASGGAGAGDPILREGMRAGELTLPPADGGIGWPSCSRAGELP